MIRKRKTEDERYMVPGLIRGLEILEVFDELHPLMSLTNLSRALSLPTSTTYRLIRTLESVGYLQSVRGTKCYRLGPRVLKLGFRYLASDEVVEIARGYLEKLRDQTGTSTHLGILDGVEVVYLWRVASRGAMTSNIHIGSRVPAHATAMGRVLLSHVEPSTLEALYRNRTLPAHTDQTITSVGDLKRVLAEDRERGYVITHSTFEAGIFAVAAPIYDTRGAVVAAINASGPENTNRNEEFDGSVRDCVLEAAWEISESLGYIARKQSTA